MFKHILIATDGSEAAGRAADKAIGLAAQVGGRVFVLYVAPPSPAFAYFAQAIQGAGVDPDEATKRADEYLLAVARKAEAAGVPYASRSVVDNRPYCEIVSVAKHEGCDLIVMGSHGYRGVDRLLLGSETHKVLLSTELPVLVCH